MEEKLKKSGSITFPEGCDNAPRKRMLIDLYKAAAACEEDYIIANVTETVKWQIIGQTSLSSREEVFKKIKTCQIQMIHLTNVITHGPTAAVNGTFEMADGTTRAFADVFRFTSAGKKGVIKEIASYHIN